ncbi:MAG: discoidin domain-containing protein [Thermoguttaceae bacterium]
MRFFLFLNLLVLSYCISASAADTVEKNTFQNLAFSAKISASTEYDGNFRAENVADGIVPGELCKHDEKMAWCVPGNQANFQGWIMFEWDEPQTIAEVVYFGRTAMILDECFRDFELFTDNNKEPVLTGTLERKHGPQRITLPNPVKAKSIRLNFLNAHTTKYNPGASEIAIFSEIPTKETIDKLRTEKLSPTDEKLLSDLVNEQLGFKDILVIQRHHVSISHVYVYHVEGYKPGGGLFIFSPDADGGKLTKILDSSDGMILDADLSYDGKEVVFSWKRGGVVSAQPYNENCEIARDNPDENYQIWKVNIDGTGLTQLTDLPCNNLNASWLPDGGIVFISDRKPAYAYCFVVTSPVLYRMDRDGSNQRRLSSNYLMDFTPSVLADGRVVFTRWEYVDRAACPIQSLWTINPDGTGLAGYFGNRILAPGTFMDTQQIPGTSKVLALATNHNGDATGGIVVIDRSFGPNAFEGILNTTPEVDIFDPGGQWGNGLWGPYEKPYPINDGVYLVTKSGSVQLRTYNADRVTILPPKDGLGFYSAQPIRVEPTPPIPMLPNDETVIYPEDGSVTGNWATVYVQDVYNGLEPTVKRGEVKKIAVVQEIEKSTFTPLIHKVPTAEGYAANTAFGYQFPLVSCGATYSPKKLWGFADVAEDGSACFQVPSEVPIYFMAIDEEGRAVQRMRTFTHLMPGEIQGCVGCHTDRNTLTPQLIENMNEPFISRIPDTLAEPDWGVKGFSYLEVVQPVLDKHCVECHNAKEHPNGLDLSGDITDLFNVSYDNLARKGTLGERNYREHGVHRDSRAEGESPYTSWIWTINGAEWNILEVAPKRWGAIASSLQDVIRTGHLDENGKPRVNVPLSDKVRINSWIDLNVPYYPTSSSNHSNVLGCRQIYPVELDTVLNDVAQRRCVECHEAGVPRDFYVRILAPENNGFLLAPLATSAGGSQKCSKPVFLSTEDEDYQKILRTFIPGMNLLKQIPREDIINSSSCP